MLSGQNALRILECIFNNNSAQNGGSIAFSTDNGVGLLLYNTVIFKANIFASNKAALGGAMYADASNILQLNNNTFI